jgi:hypothetical protein
LTNCALRNDSAASGGGLFNGATATLANCTLSDDAAVNDGGNLGGGKGNPAIDPRLGPLQDNGGPTQTLALLADSPASGHGDNAHAPRTDQRGHKRLDTRGEVTDIGAFKA